MGSMRIGNVLSLRVLDVETGKDTELRVDDNLNRGSLAWTRDGDLLASTMWRTRPNNDARQEAVDTSLLLRSRGGAEKPQVWLTRASAPVPSPDGRRVAFFGSERAPDGNWHDRSTALNIVGDDARNRRTLTRLDDGANQAFFSPDGASVWLWRFDSDTPNRGTLSSRAYNARPESEKLRSSKVFLNLESYDVATGARRIVADLEATYVPIFSDATPPFRDFKPFGLSKNGRYFLFERDEWKRETKMTGRLAVSTLWAIRLSDGKLLPVATLNAPFSLTPS